ncbi:MAG: hypothetical protein E6Q56_01100 [Mycobacterium sp.]|nr:MAG: hypothetical protein E6Q56_01100 [Mycobacterium sp.]
MSDFSGSDFSRNGFGRPAPEPSLDDIRRSDDFIEALASGRPVVPQDHADAALAALLGGWRNETRWPPDTGLISESQAIAALNAGLAEKPAREPRNRNRSPGRNHRGLGVVGAAAAAVLAIGGFGAVVSGAGPGDSLYGLRTMLFGTPREVRDDQVALAARTELTKVQELISQGDWQQAQARLVAVSSQVASVGDQQQKQELLTQFNDLSAKVVERNPEATAPPGIVYTVPPSATELVPAPAPLTDSATTTETTTSVPTTPTTTPTTSGEATSGAETSGASPSSSAPSSSATSSAGPSTVSSAPTSSAGSASTSASPSASQSAATSAATSTPGSSSTSASAAAPASTTAPAQSPATSSAPSAAAATTSATSASQSAAAATTTPTSAPPTSAAPKSAGTTAEAASPTAASQATDSQTAASPTAAVQTPATTEAAPETAIEEESTAAPATTTMAPATAG